MWFQQVGNLTTGIWKGRLTQINAESMCYHHISRTDNSLSLKYHWRRKNRSRLFLTNTFRQPSYKDVLSYKKLQLTKLSFMPCLFACIKVKYIQYVRVKESQRIRAFLCKMSSHTHGKEALLKLLDAPQECLSVTQK